MQWYTATICLAVHRWLCAILQIVNASERLTATFIDHTDLDSGRGGTANTQDLVRLIVGAYYSIRQARRSEQVKSQEPALGHEGTLLPRKLSDSRPIGHCVCTYICP